MTFSKFYFTLYYFILESPTPIPTSRPTVTSGKVITVRIIQVIIRKHVCTVLRTKMHSMYLG